MAATTNVAAVLAGGLLNLRCAQNAKSDGVSRAKGNALQACEHTTRANMRGGGEIVPAEDHALSKNRYGCTRIAAEA